MDCFKALTEVARTHESVQFTVYVAFATIITVALLLLVSRQRVHSNLDVLFTAVLANVLLFCGFDQSEAGMRYARSKLSQKPAEVKLSQKPAEVGN